MTVTWLMNFHAYAFHLWSTKTCLRCQEIYVKEQLIKLYIRLHSYGSWWIKTFDIVFWLVWSISTFWVQKLLVHTNLLHIFLYRFILKNWSKADHLIWERWESWVFPSPMPSIPGFSKLSNPTPNKACPKACILKDSRCTSEIISYAHDNHLFITYILLVHILKSFRFMWLSIACTI